MPVLRFSPFPDVDLGLEFDRSDQGSSGILWIGHIAGQPSGSTILVVGESAIAGTVRDDARQWRLRTGPEGDQFVEELDLAEFPRD
ncbi:MAG: hypothetical protein HY657_19140 [Acidobacteria bacterium]|nr:hypothetical protein [Acidobacteriota bacterium]